MSTFTLNDGNTIPSIAYGTGSALFGSDAESSVLSALQQNFKHIDAAQIYKNEASVGKALKTFLSSADAPPRSSLFVTTKFLHLTGSGSVEDTLKEQLAKLQLDYVDLYLIHSPVPYVDKFASMWKQMEDVKRKGLARSIGVSNFRQKDLEKFLPSAEIKPAVNQLELHSHVWNASATQKIFDVLEKHQIRAASYGGLKPLFNLNPNPLQSALESYRSNHHGDFSDAQIVQKWLLQRGVIVVTTTSKAERMRDSLASHTLPDLTESELAAFESAGGMEPVRFFMRHMDEL